MPCSPTATPCTSAPRMIDRQHLPARLFDRLARFQRELGHLQGGLGAFGTDPVERPVGRALQAPCTSPTTSTSSPRRRHQLASVSCPDRPFLVLGQMTTADPTRSPPGTESAWAYAHVPQEIKSDAGDDGITGRWDDRRAGAVHPSCRTADRGACTWVLRADPRPSRARTDGHGADQPNLVGGDIGGGTASCTSSSIFRPVAGWGRAETPVRRLLPGVGVSSPGCRRPRGVRSQRRARCAGTSSPAALSRSCPGRRVVCPPID